MANQSLFTPKKLSNSNSRIKRNHSNYLDTDSDRDMANQSLFTTKRSSTKKKKSS